MTQHHAVTLQVAVAMLMLVTKKEKAKMTEELSQHDQIVLAFNNYLKEHASFEEKGVKASAARARAALGDLGKLTKVRRKEIQEKKNAM